MSQLSKCMALTRMLTFHGLGVGIAAVLTRGIEELVHLLEGERVVQCLQRVDRGHHGAAFKACMGEETHKHTVAPPLHLSYETWRHSNIARSTAPFQCDITQRRKIDIGRPPGHSARTMPKSSQSFTQKYQAIEQLDQGQALRLEWRTVHTSCPEALCCVTTGFSHTNRPVQPINPLTYSAARNNTTMEVTAPHTKTRNVWGQAMSHPVIHFPECMLSAFSPNCPTVVT